MPDAHDSLDARLTRLADSTSALAPAPGFGARVLEAARAEQTPVWQLGVLSSARTAIGVALLAAAAALLLAVDSERAANAALAASYGMEIEW
jgi:hypothetical protein